MCEAELTSSAALGAQGTPTIVEKRSVNHSFWGQRGAMRIMERYREIGTLDRTCLRRVNGGRASMLRSSQLYWTESTFQAMESGETYMSSFIFALVAEKLMRECYTPCRWCRRHQQEGTTQLEETAPDDWAGLQECSSLNAPCKEKDHKLLCPRENLFENLHQWASSQGGQVSHTDSMRKTFLCIRHTGDEDPSGKTWTVHVSSLLSQNTKLITHTAKNRKKQINK